MQTFIDKFLGRNFHLALLIVVLSFLLCLWNHMTGAEFATLAGGIFGGFRAGDAVVNWIHTRDSPREEDRSHSQPSFPLTGNRDSNDRPT